jgi:tetratricopeptide (TPR) repeat protein
MSTRKIPLRLLLLILLGWVGCSKPVGQRELETGLRELRRDNYVRAKSMFEKSIARRPGHVDNATAHNYLGITAWKLGQFPEAMTAFEDSRRLNPNLIEPVYNMGVLSAERDDFRSAVRFLNEAATMNREDPRPLEFLADLYMERDQWTQARNALYSALDREPRSPRIYNSIATAHLALNQTDQSVESLMYALEANTRYAPALFNLAVIYDTRVGDADQARAYYKRFLSVAPRDERVADARAALARLDRQGALKIPEPAKVAPAAPDIPVASTNTIQPPTMVEETESPYDIQIKAAQALALAGQVQPALDGFANAAQIAADQGQVELQEKALREALRTLIDQPRAHAMLGQHFHARGKYTEATRFFRQAEALKSDYAPAQMGLARLALRKNEQDAALVHFRQAIAADPALADAQWELAQLYDQPLEMPESAARAYREFSRNFPGDPRVEAGLARAETLAPTPRPSATTSTSIVTALSVPAPGPRKLDFTPPTVRNTQAAIQAFNRGSSLQEQKDWERAIFFYLRSLEHDDQLPNTYYNLGISYTIQGDNDLARDAYQRALRLQPGWVDARYNLALLYMGDKEPDPAIRLLEEVIKSQPNYAAAHQALGVIYAGTPQTHAKAKEYYGRFLRLAPNDRAAPVIREWIASH